MDRRLVFPSFSAPPQEYTQGYFADLARQLNILTTALRSAGEGRQSILVITNMPSLDYGIEAGTLFETGGIVRISKTNAPYLSGQELGIEVGSVNVSVS